MREKSGLALWAYVPHGLDLEESSDNPHSVPRMEAPSDLVVLVQAPDQCHWVPILRMDSFFSNLEKLRQLSQPLMPTRQLPVQQRNHSTGLRCSNPAHCKGNTGSTKLGRYPSGFWSILPKDSVLVHLRPWATSDILCYERDLWQNIWFSTP
jgi:hypothetical protein